jgi:hypothetical protein
MWSTIQRGRASTMVHRFLSVVGMGSILVAVPVAALAVPQPIPVPEPATATLVAAGIGAGITVYVIRKWMRPK